MTVFARSYPLEDIHVDASGDGRTVEAYAAVFNVPAEIHDRDGHYMEVVAPGAFDKTLEERGTRFGVFYNHGLTLHGASSERGSVPIGTPLEVRADERGLYTRVRYHKTPLADEVLEAIREGSITAYSFSGRFIRSEPSRVPRRRSDGELPTVTRTEIRLTEFGPTPMPAYEAASIIGVRSAIQKIAGLPAEERAELAALLFSGLPTTTPTVGVVAGEPGPDEGHHSGRSLPARIVRARLRRMGVL